MTHIHQREADRTLEILANRHCRLTLLYLQMTEANAISLHDLASRIASSEERDETLVKLQHSTLPRLADAGLVEYDSRSDTVRYHGDDAVEEVLDAITDCYPEEKEVCKVDS